METFRMIRWAIAAAGIVNTLGHPVVQTMLVAGLVWYGAGDWIGKQISAHISIDDSTDAR